jgi:hypothetical protein
MSHLISVEIDAEIARQFVECVEHQAHVKTADLKIPVMLAEEIAEACVRALDEDDA